MVAERATPAPWGRDAGGRDGTSEYGRGIARETVRPPRRVKPGAPLRRVGRPPTSPSATEAPAPAAGEVGDRAAVERARRRGEPTIAGAAHAGDPHAAMAEGEDAWALYAREMGAYDLLSAEQERALGRRIARGDAAAVAELVTANLRLAAAVARQFEPRGRSCGYTRGDLAQEGNIGLLRAARSFDWRRGHKFSTYATWWIRQHIGRALDERGHLIRLPVHHQESLRRLATARDDAAAQLDAEPDAEPDAAGGTGRGDGGMRHRRRTPSEAEVAEAYNLRLGAEPAVARAAAYAPAGAPRRSGPGGRPLADAARVRAWAAADPETAAPLSLDRTAAPGASRDGRGPGAGVEDLSLADVLADDDPAVDPPTVLAARLRAEELARLWAAAALGPKEQRVVYLHFGLDGRYCRSLMEAGAACGVSRERARQLLESALAKLRAAGWEARRAEAAAEGRPFAEARPAPPVRAGHGSARSTGGLPPLNAAERAARALGRQLAAAEGVSGATRRAATGAEEEGGAA